ncbi:hypothetical protein PhaeoP10_02451 [Phaeobacter inhibens]|nr:hypothetical protein PhaeoP10_02451 [Phaeobacter inhibens]
MRRFGVAGRSGAVWPCGRRVACSENAEQTQANLYEFKQLWAKFDPYRNHTATYQASELHRLSSVAVEPFGTFACERVILIFQQSHLGNTAEHPRCRIRAGQRGCAICQRQRGIVDQFWNILREIFRKLCLADRCKDGQGFFQHLLFLSCKRFERLPCKLFAVRRHLWMIGPNAAHAFLYSVEKGVVILIRRKLSGLN